MDANTSTKVVALSSGAFLYGGVAIGVIALLVVGYFVVKHFLKKRKETAGELV